MNKRYEGGFYPYSMITMSPVLLTYYYCSVERLEATLLAKIPHLSLPEFYYVMQQLAYGEDNQISFN